MWWLGGCKREGEREREREREKEGEKREREKRRGFVMDGDFAEGGFWSKRLFRYLRLLCSYSQFSAPLSGCFICDGRGRLLRMSAQGQFMVVMEAVGTSLLGTEKKEKKLSDFLVFWVWEACWNRGIWGWYEVDGIIWGV